MSNVSIGGRGGSPVPDLAIVSVDNETIFGNGANEPLHVASDIADIGTFPAVITDSHLIGPGQAVRTGGGGGGVIIPCEAITSFDVASTCGLIAFVSPVPPSPGNNTVRVQQTGPLTLTTAQWDAVTGQMGGLTGGALYYLSAATASKITPTAPVATGSYVVVIGFALDSTTMIIQPGTPVGPHA